MAKIYNRIYWENKPSTKTPLNATNLNRMDVAIDELDNLVVELINSRTSMGSAISATTARLSALEQSLDQAVVDLNVKISVESLNRNALESRFDVFKDSTNSDISNLYTRVTKCDNAIKETNESVNELKIVNTTTGNTVYMADASNMKIENIIFYGESKQKTTNGNQLLNLKANTSSSVNGLSVSLESGYILKVSGKPNNVYSNLTDFAEASIPNGKYTFSVDKTPTELGVSRIGIKFRKSLADSTNVTHLISGSSKSITLERTEDYELVQIYVEGLDTSKTYNFTLKVMLNAGTTALPFEKYTGGKASPNPDYPQPIESKIVNRVDVLGKNWLKFPYYGSANKVTEGVEFITNSDKTITVNGTSTGDAYLDLYNNPNEMLVNEPIIFSKDAVNTVTLFYFERIDGKWSVGQNTTESQTEIKITPSANATGQIFRLTVQNGKTANNIKVYPMIRLASITDATYEPYQSQTVNLSEPIELNGIGGVRDSSKLKKFGVVIFDGSEDEYWGTMDTQVTGVKRMYTTKIPVKPVANNSTIPNMLCSHYKVVSPVDTFTQKEGITNSVLASDGRIYLYVYDENFNTSDISLWKAHLQANPMTVVYELAELEERSLPQSDIDAIKNLHTYKPNTVVMNDADAEMDVEYVADLKFYVDGKFRELATVIVNQ